MSRYKIATKTDTLRYKIAKEVFREIEDTDEVRDIPSWEIFEKCLEQHKRIVELEEQLKNAIVLPKELHIGCKIFWANEDGVYCGKLCAVTKDIKPNGDVNIWLYCLYDNGLSYSHLIRDFEVELFATEEEAEAKLKELKGE